MVPLLSEGIHVRRWKPEASSGSPARSCGVYLFHGTGEHCGRYEEIANRLTADGWVVGAHDHPGHGRSEGQRGSLLPEGVLSAAGIQQIEQFTKETGAPPILIGHSLGGVLATELVLKKQISVSGLVLSSPAYRPWISWSNKFKLNIMSLFAADKVVELKYRPELLTNDPAKLAESQQDDLIHGFKSARLIKWMFESGAASIRDAGQLDVDALMLIGKADPVVDPESMREWVARAPAARLTVHEYIDAYHEILNELPKIRNQVADDIITWLNQPDRF